MGAWGRDRRRTQNPSSPARVVPTTSQPLFCSEPMEQTADTAWVTSAQTCRTPAAFHRGCRETMDSGAFKLLSLVTLLQMEAFLCKRQRPALGLKSHGGLRAPDPVLPSPPTSWVCLKATDVVHAPCFSDEKLRYKNGRTNLLSCNLLMAE